MLSSEKMLSIRNSFFFSFFFLKVEPHVWFSVFLLVMISYIAEQLMCIKFLFCFWLGLPFESILFWNVVWKMPAISTNNVFCLAKEHTASWNVSLINQLNTTVSRIDVMSPIIRHYQHRPTTLTVHAYKIVSSKRDGPHSIYKKHSNVGLGNWLSFIVINFSL